ncbi:flagellar basal body rod protein FlgC [Sporolactobacillus sp. Y61]|jgi:flagellar basal-body rod protein FlgC|uniref:Flagellar basal-body rod protein FlgC n=1 Tax=Sporolactobacillus sp. Y61 TaxID=3160863 RepID=A0AAU8ICX1_9BACL|nr:flagellar basal body rod protein FlgC [Sporolactobacillus sp. THM19-2]RYL92945.1 flagellar basal body rod protein FlgC [Sporolactobacillus sp. THM19-2]
MGMFSSMDVAASGLTAQRFRMDTVSSNIANADTTRERLVNGVWQPYRRKMVHIKTIDSSFQSAFRQALGSSAGGVEVSHVTEDPSPFPQKYDPADPDADANGFVRQPNVDPLREMVDLMEANRSYDAGVTVMNASKSMLSRALDIGRQG